uniref:LRRCT domain-containing protein n=1 Tax=Homalodisca liturata TaxID=320908 RepID=A0A1B6K264_9HEMI
MVARTLWLWLCAVWLTTWLTEAIINPSAASVCDLGPCSCVRGKLLCDCSTSKVKRIVLKGLEVGSFSSISVANCGHVHVVSQALSGLPALQQFSAANIPSLTLEEQAFSWRTDNERHSGLLINITNSAIPEIPSYCFRGSLRHVNFVSVNVSHVRPFAFSSIDRADRIDFTGVHFADLEPQAFKKFSVDALSVTDSKFDVLPTRTMVDVEVHQEVKFDRVEVGTAKYSGLRIHGPRHFRMIRSRVDHADHHAFRVHTRGPVFLLDNVFTHLEKAAFAGFTVERRFLLEFGKQELIFENNTLVNFESAALLINTTGFSPRLDRIVINQHCSCPNADYWTSDLVYFSSNPQVLTPAPQVDTVLYCCSPKVDNVKEFQRIHCNEKDARKLFFVVLLALSAIVLLSSTGVVVYLGTGRKAKRYVNVPNSPSPVKQDKGGHILVIPDGKTYRETELHVIVEHAEPITPTEYIKTPPDS